MTAARKISIFIQLLQYLYSIFNNFVTVSVKLNENRDKLE